MVSSFVSEFDRFVTIPPVSILIEKSPKTVSYFLEHQFAINSVNSAGGIVVEFLIPSVFVAGYTGNVKVAVY